VSVCFSSLNNGIRRIGTKHSRRLRGKGARMKQNYPDCRMSGRILESLGGSLHRDAVIVRWRSSPDHEDDRVPKDNY